MERRLLTFIIASTAFFFIYISLRVMFGVPPEQAEGPAEPAAAEQPAADEGQVAAEGDPDAPPAAEADEGDEADGAIRRPVRPEWYTLGSMDPASGHFLLVTINGRGGGVERIELTAREPDGGLRYRRVDTLSGYLGYFSPEPALTVDGVLVNVVGPGTPAAIAEAETEGVPPGLRVGDVIVAVAGRPVATPDDLERALRETEPGDRISVEVLRGVRDQADAEAADDASDEAAEDAGGEAGDGEPQLIVFKTVLSEHPLDLVRLAKYGGPDQVAGNVSRLSCLMTLSRVNQKSAPANDFSIDGLPDPAALVWDGSRKTDGETEIAEFSLTLTDDEMQAVGGSSVRLRRRYTLQPGSYVLGMTVQLDNLGDQPQSLAYRLAGVNGLTLEGWWYSNKISPNWGGAAARDIVYKTDGAGHDLISGYALLKQARRQPSNAAQAIFAPDGEPPSRQLHYIGVDAQYFTAAYLPPEGAEGGVMTNFRRAEAGIVALPDVIPEDKERAVNTSFTLDSVVTTVPPGQSLRDEMRLYAGPKDPVVLDDYGLGQVVYYGWFSGPAKVLAGLLHFLYGLIGNYGIAIILLTILVRGAMFPLSRKAAINAQKMQELAPELKKIGEKYKDDMEGRLKAQRELQQRVGFNPMAGCLPMFLQLPIFIGLYRALSVDIELRQAAFHPAISWASNLAGPDMLYYWGDWMWDYLSGRGTGWLGPYFNILPVIVVLLFLLQQKLFMPPATDEQTAMTQKIMSWMTLVMGLFFFRVPAGLCIYFITSSLWGICERVLVKRTLPQKKHFDQAVLEGVGPAGPAKSSTSLAERLRQQMSPSEPPAQRPSQRKRPATGKKTGGGKKKR